MFLYGLQCGDQIDRWHRGPGHSSSSTSLAVNLMLLSASSSPSTGRSRPATVAAARDSAIRSTAENTHPSTGWIAIQLNGNLYRRTYTRFYWFRANFISLSGPSSRWIVTCCDLPGVHINIYIYIYIYIYILLPQSWTKATIVFQCTVNYVPRLRAR